jgi:hypothetical protein
VTSPVASHLPGSHERSRLARSRAPMVVGATAVLGAVALHLRDPNVSGSWGYCPVRLATGWDCPGCGSLRAVHALTEGELGTALSSNVVTVALLPLAVVLWVAWTRRAWRGGGAPVLGSSRRQLLAGVAVATALLAFGLVRNLPGAGWLLS